MCYVNAKGYFSGTWRTVLIIAQWAQELVRRPSYQSGSAVAAQGRLQQFGQNRISVGNVQDLLPRGCVRQSTGEKKKNTKEPIRLKACIRKRSASLGLGQERPLKSLLGPHRSGTRL